MTAVHVLLGLMLLYAMHKPIRHAPAQDSVITLLANPKQAPLPAPIPLAMAKRVVTSTPAPDLPPVPQIEVNVPAQVAPAVVTPVKQIAQETYAEPAKEIASAEDSAPTIDANAEGNPKPAYPKASRALGEQGRVLLDVYVQVDGTVGDIRLHQSSGFGRLDESAMRAVRQWHFKPARQAGKQIAVWYVQPITFDLHNA